jgi:hypothetical protein
MVSRWPRKESIAGPIREPEKSVSKPTSRYHKLTCQGHVGRRDAGHDAEGLKGGLLGYLVFPLRGSSSCLRARACAPVLLPLARRASDFRSCDRR